MNLTSVKKQNKFKRQQSGENICKIYDKALISLLYKELLEYIKKITLWILRKKISTKKGFWWLTGLKLKQKPHPHPQSLAAVSTQGPLMQTALQGEVCTVLPAAALNRLGFCHLNQPLQRSAGNPVSTIGLRLSPSSWSWAAISPISFFTKQSEHLHSDQSGQYLDDQIVTIWSPYLQEDWPIRDQGGNFRLYKSAHLQFTVPLHFPGWSWNTEGVSSRAERSSLALAPWPLHSRGALQLRCITIELFCAEWRFLLHPTPSWGFLLALNWRQRPLGHNINPVNLFYPHS